MKADRYSKVVGLLKVLLPLMALALLSTLFLLSRVIDPHTVIPFADKEIQDRLRDQQVTGPIYYAVTADGDEISFAAEKVTTPDGETGGNEAEDVKVTMKLGSGSDIVLNAKRGHFNIAADSTSLQGEVVINTSTGYRIESDLLVTQMSVLDVESPGPVAATGPVGTVDAGAMTLKAGKPSHLVFTNGVKLIYSPEQDKE
ncbi:LPS export ABC transporter periplasmic protein LptC [Sulfitobacter pacificus]|uniref:Lipopolysaccharide export system protein LptC n=1 Tax=Sulfitobacter pacificus TaxID=1499314 RepID=A0ABQ5VME6_9RHOB|nr:LPS export ABC transporter periplasmic protein LptC [Sulfitobacter pacificus]GLQ28227.1 hypothetical protein GCM10007927_30300 [Sulfitobacter pacificus]